MITSLSALLRANRRTRTLPTKTKLSTYGSQAEVAYRHRSDSGAHNGLT